METEMAIDIIGRMAVLPGWELEASSTPTPGEVELWVTNPNPYTDPDSLYEDGTYHVFPADEGRPSIRNPFYFSVEDLDYDGLFVMVLSKVLEVNAHEWREALRDQDTMVSPLHPHREEGIDTFARVSGLGVSSVMADLDYNTVKYDGPF